MLINIPELILTYNMKVTGVLHVGAHTGEEAQAYHSAGINTVWWIEGNPDLIPALSAHVARFGHHVINALITDRDDVDTTFNIANNMQSSSVLDFGSHLTMHPEVAMIGKRVLRSRTLDSLMTEHEITGCNFWNFDLQGAELLALQGAIRHLSEVDYLYLEVNREQVYVGNPLIGQLDSFLDGFKRVETEWCSVDGGWGDALWIRN